MELQPLDLPPLPKAASALTAEAATSSARLHGSKQPARILVEEKPWHRAAALMVAAGSVTQKEIAEAFDVCPATVSTLMRQQWFQERVTQLMEEHGGKDIMELFKGEGINSFITLVELRDNTKVPAPVRAKCALDILDRALGKPLQRIETKNENSSADPVSEVKRLEESLLRKRESLFPGQGAN